MKTHLLQRSLLFFLSCLILIVFESCKKTNNQSNSVSYRPVGFLMYDYGLLTDSAKYKYEGEKLLEGVDYSIYYQDSIQSFYSYPDDNSIEVITFKNTQKYEYSYFNGQMTRMLLSYLISNIWKPQEQFTYQYQDGKLVEEIWYDGSNDGIKPRKRFTYEYDGNKLIRSRLYYSINSNWQEVDMEEAIYTGNLITKIIRYTLVDSGYVDYNYIDLHYKGTSLAGYFMYSTGGNELSLSYLFSYDVHGNMVIRESAEKGERKEFSYEEGEGNFQQLSRPGGGIAGFVVPLPWPTK